MTSTVHDAFDRYQGQRSTVSPSFIDTCLKPREVDTCAKFIAENQIDLYRFHRLYDVAKKVRFGQFLVDFTQFGASTEDCYVINQLYRAGLNFHQLDIYLQHKRSGYQ